MSKTSAEGKATTATSNKKNSSANTNNTEVEFFRGAIDQSGTPSIMINRDLVITYANQATLDLMKKHEAVFQERFPGFKAERDLLIGTSIDNFHKHPEHQQRLLADESNLPYKTDIQIGLLTFELNVTGIKDSSGNYIGNSLEWQDVTEARAKANQAARLQGAIDQSGTASIMIDRDFTVTYVNQATMELLKKHETTFKQKWPGFKAEKEILLGACIDVFHKNPEHQRNLLADETNLPYKTDIRIEHLTFELNVTAINDAAGNYIGNSLEWQDVTDIRLRQLEVGRLSSAVEGMTTNLMMADLDGNIVYMNPAVTRMLQRREAELQKVLPSFNVASLVGTNFDTFHKNPAHQRSVLSNTAAMPYETSISVAGLEFNLTAIALKDGQGKHVGSAVQWIDQTEEKDAQRQIEQLIAAAINGELDARIDASNYQGFMKGLAEGINQLMDAVVQPITATIDVTQALAQGDLSRSMDGEYGGEFLALANAVNDSMDNLRGMVQEIRSASGSVFTAAGEIAQGNSDLSVRTESQASSLEETASAMEELTTTVQQNAENATQATQLANGAMHKASNGGEVVSSAVTAMEEINKSSKKIADIIGVIDEIAFQTNLLALNAAVEAARAGEQGRGFAVVAAEVRNLAQRSAGAAKEIKGLINDSVEAVGKGTKLVDETGQTFKELVQAVTDVVKMISDIDSASSEQASGINEVSQAVGQMDEMTQQNAALVEEATAAAKSMEEQSQSLMEQVSYFKTGEEEANVVKLSSHRTSPTENHPTSHPGSRGREENRRKPAPRRMAVRDNNDDEWEEF